MELLLPARRTRSNEIDTAPDVLVNVRREATPLAAVSKSTRLSVPRRRRPQQRPEVADRPEVRQLIGVDDRVDARDLTGGDIERHHADQPLLCVEKERSRAAVDLDGTPRHAGSAVARRSQAISVRATRLRPCSDRASAFRLSCSCRPPASSEITSPWYVPRDRA